MFAMISRLSIRWKLQFAFFAVTMITTIFNRWLATIELQSFIDITRQHQVSPDIINILVAKQQQFIFNAFWESGLELIVQFLVIAIVANALVKPLNQLIRSLKSVSKGDLTRNVEIHSQDEIGQIEAHFNTMLTRLNRMMNSIDHCSTHMAQSAYQITTVSKEIEVISSMEEKRSEEVSAATKELHGMSIRVNETAQSTLSRAETTLNRARDAVSAIQSNTRSMNQVSSQISIAANDVQNLQEYANQIVGIIDSIASIAEQTNLLALNAAIEAARAGAHGRGFAVVADEVRSLASRTAESSQEVSGIIDNINRRVDSAAATMTALVEQIKLSQKDIQTSELLIQEMGKDVRETTTMTNEISQASIDQLHHFESLENSINTLISTLHENTAKISNTTYIGDALYRLTQQLNEEMSGLQFNKERPAETLPKGAERRTEPRTYGNMLTTLIASEGRFDCLTQDISLKGMRITMKNRVHKNQEVILSIRLPQSDKQTYQNRTPCQLNGEIRWHKEADGSHEYGISFTTDNKPDSRQLQEILDFYNRS